MPGGDKPGSSGSETPDQKTSASTTGIQSEQIEKSDIMSDPESSTSDPRSNESESGSGLQTPDLTADYSLSLPSERKEKSTDTEVPLGNKEMCGALTDSEISKSDPSAESDTSSGLQSPDLKTDSSQTPTLEHLTGQRKEMKDFVPMDKSGRAQYEEVEVKVVNAENLLDEVEAIPLEVIPQGPQVANEVAIQDANEERSNSPEPQPDVQGPTRGNRVWNAIYRCPDRCCIISPCLKDLPLYFKWILIILLIIVLLLLLIRYLVGLPGGLPLNITLANDTFLPTENTSILNLND